jgi:hypothetical protein
LKRSLDPAIPAGKPGAGTGGARRDFGHDHAQMISPPALADRSAKAAQLRSPP